MVSIRFEQTFEEITFLNEILLIIKNIKNNNLFFYQKIIYPRSIASSPLAVLGNGCTITPVCCRGGD